MFCNTAFLHLGVGFNVPSAVEAECMLRDTHKIGDNLYSVPSRSEKGEIYVVDISYYESLHQPVLMNEHLQDDHEKASSTEKISSLPEESVYNCMTATLPEELPTTLTCTANEHLSEVFDVLSEKISQGNTEFNKAILTFAKRFDKLSENQLLSALHSVGSIFVGKARSRIKVQPTAVSRRKSKIGSRRKQDTKRVFSNKELPIRLIKTKRKHNISEVVDKNQPSAKKAGRSMVSVTTYPKKKITQHKI